MNSHDGGDAAQRLRCTHLSFDYARGKYPERVQEDHSISLECRFAQGVAAALRLQGVPAVPQGESPSAQGVKKDDEVATRLLDVSITLVLAVEPSSRLLPDCRLPTADFFQKCQRPALVRVQPRFTHVVAIEEA
jgi:hypothetical protein